MVLVIAQEAENLSGRRRGRCKWFNVAKGWGFITPSDGGPDVFVHQSVIQMGGFRSLGDEEEVEFECKVSDKGLEATLVTGCEGLECKGSHRRPMSKKKFKKVRCYNCGEFANHIAAKCNMDPQPKKCHHCKAVDHLIADCPAKKDDKKNKKNKQSTQSNCITSSSDNQNDNDSKSISSSEITSTSTPSVTKTATTTITVPSTSSPESESNESVSSSSSCCIINNDAPEDEDEEEVVNTNCCSNNNEMNSINSKLVDSCNVNGETSEDDVSLVVMETQSTSSSISSSSPSSDDNHEGKQARSDSGIVHDDEDNCTTSRNSNCDINNNLTITTPVELINEIIETINVQNDGQHKSSELKTTTIKPNDEINCDKSSKPIESTPSDNSMITITINDPNST